MQKKLIALAITAAFSAPAFADTAVYGKVDAGFGRGTANTISTTGADGAKTTASAVVTNQFYTSRIGFKGTEDLGNGMKAMAVVETTIGIAPVATTTGSPSATSLGSRELNVALGFSEGTTVKAGFGSTAVRNIAYGYDAIYGANIIGNLLTANSPVSAVLTSRATSLEATHKFGPVSASANLMVNGSSTDGQQDVKNGSGYEIAAKFDQDALSAAFGYRNTKVAPGGASSAEATTKVMILGASFDLGVAKLAGQYASVKVDQATVGPAVSDSNALSLGAYVPFTPEMTGFVQYSNAKQKTLDQKSTGYALGVKYDMSKSTFGYASYGATKTDGVAAAGGSKQTQLALGVVQSF